jgi:predicted SnoaL-like aldol condensation-catalyzing enzyme
MFSLTSAISPVRRSTGHRTSSVLVVVDILRIKDGLFEEHWDVIEPEATQEESKSKLPMVGYVFPK